MNYLLYILLLLFGSNFMTQAAVFGIILLAYSILVFKKVTINKTMALLIVTCFAYIINYSINYGVPPLRIVFSRAVGLIILYMVGTMCAKKGTSCFYNCLFTFGFGFAVHGMLNVFINLNTNLVDIQGRAYIDIWGEGVLAATGQSLFFVPATVLFFSYIFNLKNRVLKYFGIFITLVAVYGSLTSGSRTLLLLIPICFCISLLLYFHYNKVKKSKMRIFTISTVIIIIITVIFNYNLFSASDWLSQTGLMNRFGGNPTDNLFSTSRIQYSIDVLRLILDYPLGNIPVSHNAHNLWLDIAREVGLVPALFHLFFCLFAIRGLVKLVKSNCIKYEYKIISVASYAGIFTMFFIEPIMNGNPYFYMYFCFLVGGIDCLNAQNKSSQLKNAAIER